MELLTPFELFGMEVSKGWWPLVEPIFNRIQELNAQGHNIEISQIKEKWGELCIYTTGETDEIWDMIQVAEEKSHHICEVCGKPGERIISETSWIYTRCTNCIKKEKIKVSGTVDEFNRRMKEAGELPM